MPTPTGYTRSPRLQPGAIIQLNREIVGVFPSITLFQYNPESISRSFDFYHPQGNQGGLVSKTDEAFAPGESYSFRLELDATDDLEKGRPLAESYGVADRLAVLERLIYAPAGLIGGFVESYVTLLGAGPLTRARRQVVPIVLLALGRRRVLPVRVTSLSITESAHSPAMMPIHAQVELSFSIIQPHELPKYDGVGLPEPDVELAKAAYRLYRFQREALAVAHIATVVSDLGGLCLIAQADTSGSPRPSSSTTAGAPSRSSSSRTRRASSSAASTCCDRASGSITWPRSTCATRTATGGSPSSPTSFTPRP